MRLMESGGVRKVPLDGRIQVQIGNWEQVKDSKGERPDRGRQARPRVRNSFGTSVMGGRRKRAVAAGGWEQSPGGQSLCEWKREGGKK